jgi:hypothetical protein
MSTTMINQTGVKLGSFVRTHKHGHAGRVMQIHLSGCPQDQAWQDGQSIPLEEGEAQEVWFSVLVEPAGSVVVSERDIEVMEPFEFHNPWAAEYFA